MRAWREDSGDITRILLTAIADPLARQDARMSDTITLCTRILLTTQDLHSKKDKTMEDPAGSETPDEADRSGTWLNR